MQNEACSHVVKNELFFQPIKITDVVAARCDRLAVQMFIPLNTRFTELEGVLYW